MKTNINMEKTKLALLLEERGLTQTDLYNLIKDSGEKPIGKDRINKMVMGRHQNYTVDTAKTLARVLGVTLDELVE
jgi:antitoxin component HigA of HigAB toxin-antitoxin module